MAYAKSQAKCTTTGTVGGNGTRSFHVSSSDVGPVAGDQGSGSGHSDITPWDGNAATSITLYFHTFMSATGLTVPTADTITVAVYDANGNLVITLANAITPPANGTSVGTFYFTSDGTSSGSPRCGQYEVRLTAVRTSGSAGLNNYNVNSATQALQGALRGNMLVSAIATTSSQDASGTHRYGTAGDNTITTTVTHTQQCASHANHTFQKLILNSADSTFIDTGTSAVGSGTTTTWANVVGSNYSSASSTYGSAFTTAGMGPLLATESWTLPVASGVTQNGTTSVKRSAYYTVAPAISLTSIVITPVTGGTGVVNRGEATSISFGILNSGSVALTRAMSIAVKNSLGSTVQTTTPSGSTYVVNYTIGVADDAANTSSGVQWTFATTQANTHNVSSNAFKVSSLYYGYIRTQLSSTLSGFGYPNAETGSDTNFVIAGDLANTWVFLTGVRQDNTNINTTGSAITLRTKKPDGSINQTFNLDTGPDATNGSRAGWTPNTAINPAAPSGAWTYELTVSFNGNSLAATFVHALTYITPLTSNLVSRIIMPPVVAPGASMSVYLRTEVSDVATAPQAVPTYKVAKITTGSPDVFTDVISSTQMLNVADATATINGSLYKATFTAPATPGQYELYTLTQLNGNGIRNSKHFSVSIMQDPKVEPVFNVRGATTAALAAHTRSGDILTASANGAFPTTDGLTYVLNDVILVKNEGSGTHLENGAYYLSQVGSVSTPWTLTRINSMNSSTGIQSGAMLIASAGTANAGTVYRLSTANPITVNTTALTFGVVGSTLAAGNGISITGSNPYTIAVNPDGTTLDTGAAGNALQVKALGIGTSQIAASAVTSAKLASGAAASNVGALSGSLTGTLPSPGIAASAITATELASSAVTAAKIAAGAAASNVGALSGSLAGTLPSPTIAAGAIGTTELAAAAVTSAKMGAGAAASNIGSLSGDLSGTLPSPAIASGAVTAAKMAAGAAASNVGALSGSLGGTLPSPSIAAGAVGTTELAATSVTSAKLAAGAASANVGALSGDVTGTLPAISIASSAVTAAKIAASAVTAAKLNSDVAGAGVRLNGTSNALEVNDLTIPWTASLDPTTSPVTTSHRHLAGSEAVNSLFIDQYKRDNSEALRNFTGVIGYVRGNPNFTVTGRKASGTAGFQLVYNGTTYTAGDGFLTDSTTAWTWVGPAGTESAGRVLTVSQSGNITQTVTITVDRTAPTVSLALAGMVKGTASGTPMFRGEYAAWTPTYSDALAGVATATYTYGTSSNWTSPPSTAGASGSQNAYVRSSATAPNTATSDTVTLTVTDAAGNSGTATQTIYFGVPTSLGTPTIGTFGLSNSSPLTLYNSAVVESPTDYNNTQVQAAVTSAAALAACRNSATNNTQVSLISGTLSITQANLANQTGTGPFTITATVSSQSSALGLNIKGQVTDQYYAVAQTAAGGTYDYNANKATDISTEPTLLTPSSGFNTVGSETYYDAYVPTNTSQRGVLSKESNVSILGGQAKSSSASTNNRHVVRVLLPSNNATNTQYRINLRGSAGVLSSADATVEWSAVGAGTYSSVGLNTIFTGPTGAAAIDLRITIVNTGANSQVSAAYVEYIA